MTKRQKLWALVPISLVIFWLSGLFIPKQVIEPEEIIVGSRVIEEYNKHRNDPNWNPQRRPGPIKRKPIDNSETPVVRYVPPEGRVEVRPKDPTKTLDELVEIKIKWYGLTLKPGMAWGLLPSAFGMDLKLAYLGRIGAEFGISKQGSIYDLYGLTPRLSLSYRLDRIKFIQNTELYVGWTPLGRYPAEVGLRWNL
jgi:hypothetical protein